MKERSLLALSNSFYPMPIIPSEKKMFQYQSSHFLVGLMKAFYVIVQTFSDWSLHWTYHIAYHVLLIKQSVVTCNYEYSGSLHRNTRNVNRTRSIY